MMREKEEIESHVRNLYFDDKFRSHSSSFFIDDT